MTRRPILDDEREALQQLGALLAHARRTAGLTQWQLAAGTGLGERHLQRLEAGQRRTRASTLDRVAEFLARALDCDADALLDLLLEAGDGVLAPESEFEAKVARRRRNRSERAWQAEMRRGDRLARLARRRSLPEERRRLARLTRVALRTNAGLLPY